MSKLTMVLLAPNRARNTGKKEISPPEATPMEAVLR